MLLYGLIMFAVAILILWLSIGIYRGKTSLIHDYHQAKVTDKAAYGKAFGKALLPVGLAPVLSGILSLCGTSGVLMGWSVGVLFVGIGIGVSCIIRVQKKYNQGVF